MSPIEWRPGSGPRKPVEWGKKSEAPKTPEEVKPVAAAKPAESGEDFDARMLRLTKERIAAVQGRSAAAQEALRAAGQQALANAEKDRLETIKRIAEKEKKLGL